MEKIELTSEQEEQVVKNLLPFQCSDSLNIAVIGRSGVGKSSFINAFRNLTCKDITAAKEKAGSECCEIEREYAKYGYKISRSLQNSEVEIEINFFDTMGFMDNKNSDIDAILDKIKDDHLISEFDAIIFICDNRLFGEELEKAKKYEEKNVLLFFVYNKMDDFLEKKIKELTGNCSKKKTFDDQYNDNKNGLIECINKETDVICETIDKKMVFSSFLKDVEKFNSNILKSGSYKQKIIKNSLYFITSNKEDFLNECYSKDGTRLKTEIEKYLVDAKLKVFNIDLLDPFSERIIRLKKKYLLSNLFKDMETKLKMAGNTAVNLIPGLDTLLSYIPKAKNISEKEMIRNLKIIFMQNFGISDLREKLSNQADSISNNREKIKILENIFTRIDNDEVINSLDLISDSFDNNKSSNKTIKDYIIKFFINLSKNMPSFGSIGAVFAKLFDEIIKLIPFATKVSVGLLSIISLGSIPVAISIYVCFLQKTFEKILFKYEEYALIIFETLHNDLELSN